MTMTEMKIKAIAPWFGGKRNLASTIVEELGEHSSYFEPFCGAMSILLNKPVSSHENVNDLHGDLINLARTIQHPELGAKLYRRLRRTWLHEDVHEEARATMRDCGEVPKLALPDPDRAYWYFIFSWIGRNGTAGTANINCGFCRRWTPHGGHGAKRFASAVCSIPAWRNRMRNVTILRMDGFEMLSKIEDNVRTAIYADPPYLTKGTLYVHDFDPADRQRLASELHRFRKSRVVLSYYDHPMLAELYPDWTKRVIEVSKALAHQGRRGKNNVKAREVLLINGPSLCRLDQHVGPWMKGETT